MLTQARLKELLNYDEASGVFTWAKGRPGCSIGSVAGYDDCQDGYLIITVDRTAYRAHRLAWLYVHGQVPPNGMDHVDGNRKNNAITNLRLATQADNMQNRARNKNAKNPYKGVNEYWGRWRARIYVGGRRYELGVFDSAEDARDAYRQAKANLHTFQPEDLR